MFMNIFPFTLPPDIDINLRASVDMPLDRDMVIKKFVETRSPLIN